MGTIVYRTIAQALAEFVKLNFFGYIFATLFSTSPYMFTRGGEGERGRGRGGERERGRGGGGGGGEGEGGRGRGGERERGGEGEGEGERERGGESPAPTEILFNLQTIQHCSDNSPVAAQTQSPSQAD